MQKKRESMRIDQCITQIIFEKQPETVEQLIRLVQLEYSIPKQKIIKQILRLQNRGKLTLKEHPTLLPLPVKGYILSAKVAWYWTIVALALAAAALVFIIPEDAYPIIYARHMVGSIFVLLFPGYTFIKVLFPTKELDNIERTALSIGTSLALVPVTSLLLNYTPLGIRTTPVTLSLLVLTITFATIAVIRERSFQTLKRDTVS